ncbi:undecaprenyl-diphosphatase [Neobacillus sp. SM06]|uniref:undecaprenyl-diphosphatase n=1 Tax=Neobacillus sp. SM06 TaxID=3422492 RepID=UPI003D2D0050
MGTKLFRDINFPSSRSFILDRLMIILSTKMRYVFFFVFIVMWFKKSCKKISFESGVSVIFACISHFLIKLVYFKPRPFLKRKVGILIPSKTDSSFPSKHTILVFAFSTTLIFYRRFLGSIMSVLSFLTGLSRIWVGHHYPSDIVGSAIIGSLISMVVHMLARVQKWLPEKS